MIQSNEKIPKESFFEKHGSKVVTTALLLLPFVIGLTISMTQEEIYREKLLKPVGQTYATFEGAYKATIENRAGISLDIIQNGFLYHTIQGLCGLLMILGLYFVYKYVKNRKPFQSYLKTLVFSILIIAATIGVILAFSYVGGLSFKGTAIEGFVSMEPFSQLSVLPWEDLKSSQLEIYKRSFSRDKLKYTFVFRNGETRTLLVGFGAIDSIRNLNVRIMPTMSAETKKVVDDLLKINF